MKKILLYGLLFAAMGCATKKDGAAGLAKYSQGISLDAMKVNLTVIAADDMEGRETGSEGQKKAGRYLIEQYRQHEIPFPKGATDYYQKVPDAFSMPNTKKTFPTPRISGLSSKGQKTQRNCSGFCALRPCGHEERRSVQWCRRRRIGHSGHTRNRKAFQKAKAAATDYKRSVLILHVTGEEHGLHGSLF
jgi:hypothetical protein